MRESDSPREPEPTGRRRANKLIVLSLMGLVALAECAIVYFLLPSADEVTAGAAAQLVETPASLPPLTQEILPARQPGPVTEVELGNYSITIHRPASSTTLRIDFQLVGTVLKPDENEFARLFASTKHRFRDQIIIEIRNSEIPDLADPGLTLIKRRILEKSNALLGKPLLRAIVFSDFSFIEQ